ncbi:MAG: class I SAM-dependent methyltransferase [Candidatus Kapabacteria bacterium]|nr:class I SAM-dependent methyltransferase [Candidatus Kapabacteria bacterium]MDW8012664.1 class I SAM-dependent methyltransferase [Bacteroidota bacterium]
MTSAEELCTVVQQADDIDAANKYYWAYQFRLGHEVLVPQLRAWGVFKPGTTVAEIGCAEAGVLMAFVLAGAKAALGTDIAASRLHAARLIADRANIEVELSLHDVLQDPIPERWQGQYELILLRDVLEHLEDPAEALRRLRTLLRAGGFVFITFPPYPSPYGGHQHLLKTFWGKLPYIHLLPDSLFEHLIASGQEPDRSEVHRLRRIRLSLPTMLQIAKSAGYRIVAEEHYLLRPVFRYRFGRFLPTPRITPLARRIPSLAQYFCMEAGYLLQWSGTGS